MTKVPLKCMICTKDFEFKFHNQDTNIPAGICSEECNKEYVRRKTISLLNLPYREK